MVIPSESSCPPHFRTSFPLQNGHLARSPKRCSHVFQSVFHSFPQQKSHVPHTFPPFSHLFSIGGPNSRANGVSAHHVGRLRQVLGDVLGRVDASDLASFEEGRGTDECRAPKSKNKFRMCFLVNENLELVSFECVFWSISAANLWIDGRRKSGVWVCEMFMQKWPKTLEFTRRNRMICNVTLGLQKTLSGPSFHHQGAPQSGRNHAPSRPDIKQASGGVD